MPHDITTSEYPTPLHFRRKLHRLIIPCVFAIWMFGLFAYRIPDGIWIAGPGLCVILLLCALLHGGIVMTREGIEWYILHPKWRYRFVPWGAVKDVRKFLFVLHPIRLIVTSGRYERWAWGTPRPGREMEIGIWPRSYYYGETMWDAIQHFRSLQDQSAEETVANGAVVSP